MNNSKGIKENNFENKNKNIFSSENNLEKKDSNKKEKKNIFLCKKTIHFKTDKMSVNSKKKGDNNIFNEGKWSKEEHDKFLEGIELYGMNWKKVKKLVDIRTLIQVRSHDQKFYNRMKLYKDENLGINFTLNSIHNIKDMINQIKSISSNYNIKNTFKYLSYKYINYERSKKKSIKNIKNNSQKNKIQKNVINLQENNYYNNSNIFQKNEINTLESFKKKIYF